MSLHSAIPSSTETADFLPPEPTKAWHSWGENSKINASNNFTSLQVRFWSDRRGKNRQTPRFFSYGICNTLLSIIRNIAFWLHMSCDLMRPDYERSTVADLLWHLPNSALMCSLGLVLIESMVRFGLKGRLELSSKHWWSGWCNLWLLLLLSSYWRSYKLRLRYGCGINDVSTMAASWTHTFHLLAWNVLLGVATY